VAWRRVGAFSGAGWRAGGVCACRPRDLCQQTSGNPAGKNAVARRLAALKGGGNSRCGWRWRLTPAIGNGMAYGAWRRVAAAAAWRWPVAAAAGLQARPAAEMTAAENSNGAAQAATARRRRIRGRRV